MNAGNSNRITREYLDSLLVETRYLDAAAPDTTLQLYGRTFPTPVMTAALSHLDHFMEPGSTEKYAEGAAGAGVVTWIGMSSKEEIELVAGKSPAVVEIIKPYRDRDLIFRKIEHAEKQRLLAVGIDIDHPFAEGGAPDFVDGFEMKAMTTAELGELCRSTKLPLIVKGVLSVRDADRSLSAGAGGVLLSHHNNRIGYAVPPLMALGEIRKAVGGRIPIFVDDEIATGMDAFKALALGATAVGIGRPLMTAIRDGGAEGMAEYLRNVTKQLAYVMACTGCTSLSAMDASVIHKS
ncbi:alpha-hydroxy acid oxidase [Lachnoclostridium sp. Marseille-P6806]|uniref:alpha-hydroxy acid oxidase n=1 Tax=Lachnoclostridium sp. Marseille-P6806 TaxID=2364793 RepID=UPI00103250D7|nr:alpha-hydroxy acid oxidase [Lachnoclostridium sp. Marseille-P6806]